MDESLVAEDLVAHRERQREIEDDSLGDEKLAHIREKEDAKLKRQEELRTKANDHSK